MRLQKCMMPHMQWQLTAEQCTIDLNICRAIVLERKRYENRGRDRDSERTELLMSMRMREWNSESHGALQTQYQKLEKMALEKSEPQRIGNAADSTRSLHRSASFSFVLLLTCLPCSGWCWAVHKFIRMMQFICSVALVSTTLLVVWCGADAFHALSIVHEKHTEATATISIEWHQQKGIFVLCVCRERNSLNAIKSKYKWNGVA